MQAETDIPIVPPEGWQLEDFPQMSITPVAYTTSTGVRADPAMAISPRGWLTVDIGGMRIGFPSRDEWTKFVNMGERMYNSHQLAQQKEDIEKMIQAQTPPTTP